MPLQTKQQVAAEDHGKQCGPGLFHLPSPPFSRPIVGQIGTLSAGGATEAEGPQSWDEELLTDEAGQHI